MNCLLIGRDSIKLTNSIIGRMDGKIMIMIIGLKSNQYHLDDLIQFDKHSIYHDN